MQRIRDFLVIVGYGDRSQLSRSLIGRSADLRFISRLRLVGPRFSPAIPQSVLKEHWGPDLIWSNRWKTGRLNDSSSFQAVGCVGCVSAEWQW